MNKAKAPRRRVITTPGERIDPARRGPGTVVVSVAIHLVAIAVLIRVAIVPIYWLNLGAPDRPRAEHLTYIKSPADTASRQKVRAGGDNRAATNTPAAAPIAAPSEVPSVLPPEPPKNAAPAPDGGSGAQVGAGGPTRGLVPAFTDPRIWAPTDPAPLRPRTQTEKLDSAIAFRIHHVEDSLAALGQPRAPGDWTWGKDGKKYGIDQKYIHLGNFSIPTALLALLPLNVQGNPTAYENGKHFGQVRGEILEQTARQARDADFNAAVKELRDRKQKERADKEKAEKMLPLAPPVRIIP